MNSKPFSGWLKHKSLMEYSTLGTEYVNDLQINSVYNKARTSVGLVQLYSRTTGQKLLNNISTIATLDQSAYGLYNSGENKKIIGPSVLNKIKMKFGPDILAQNKLNNVPSVVIRQYIPDIHPEQIQPSDVIRVNVRKILSQFGDSMNSVLEIASTIVHEATHEIERETLGKTSEVGPQLAEKKFINWVQNNMNLIYQKFPQLKNFK